MLRTDIEAAAEKWERIAVRSIFFKLDCHSQAELMAASQAWKQASSAYGSDGASNNKSHSLAPHSARVGSLAGYEAANLAPGDTLVPL